MPTLTLCQLVAGAPLSRLPSQACDRCSRNKTRCDRLPVCTSCRKADAACSYNKIPRRRGPRRRRMSAHNRTDGSAHNRTDGSAHNRTDGSAHNRTNGSAHRGETETPPQPPEADLGESPAFSTLLDPPGQAGYVPGPYCGASGVPGLLRGDEAQSSLGTVGSRSPTGTASSPHSSSSQSNGAPEPSHVAGIMGFMADPTSEGACLLETGAPPPAGGQPSGMNDSIRLPAANSPIFQDNDLGEARIPAWMETSAAAAQLPRSVFLPYVELFLERLYPVFPVLDRHAILTALQDPLLERHPLHPSFYCFLAALSAATIVQLNVTGPLSDFDTHQASGAPGIMTLSCSEEFFVAESLRTRHGGDFIECADEYTVLSSFFLFAYYGNMDRSRLAWYYLREAIGFSLSMGLDNSEAYLLLDKATQQRRRRLFWLLFVTERAYALQHRSTVILRPSLELPRVFESSEPKLIYGFVTLVKVFRAVDEAFLSAWGADQPDARDYSDESAPASMTTQLLNYSEDGPGALSMAEVDETQRLDILVTREWLRTLVWRLRLQHGARLRSRSGSENQPLFQQDADAHHPFQISRHVLEIISTSQRLSLEAHGIGMEQKVFDLASSLSDSLQKEAATLTPSEFFSGQDLLHNFVTILASFRNQTSRYLQPLLRHSAAVLSMGGIQMNPPMVGDMEENDSSDAQTAAFLGMDGTAD